MESLKAFLGACLTALWLSEVLFWNPSPARNIIQEVFHIVDFVPISKKADEFSV